MSKVEADRLKQLQDLRKALLASRERESKKVDLYEILLDAFIEILKQHGITEVSILNEFTHSVEKQCQQALTPKEEIEISPELQELLDNTRPVDECIKALKENNKALTKEER